MSKRENLRAKINEKGESMARKAKLARVRTHKRLGTSRDTDTAKRGTMVIGKELSRSIRPFPTVVFK